ncbi:hypothetical protein Tco_0950943 [Tanacetum coccineum]|uniref:Uncharacterized protein n=1 Tax=Tanacetum coccineum TaxID=301880 RepID=A0ABQ5DUG9_9ASTR
MRADELYKFSDGTSRRKWMAIDKNRSELMVELIDNQMRERRIIRNLKRLNIKVILSSIYSDDEYPSSVNIKQHSDVPVMSTCKHGESNTYVLEDLTLLAQNPLKEEALGGYTCNLDSFGKKQDKIAPLQRSGFKNILTESGDGVVIS